MVNGRPVEFAANLTADNFFRRIFNIRQQIYNLKNNKFKTYEAKWNFKTAELS